MRVHSIVLALALVFLLVSAGLPAQAQGIDTKANKALVARYAEEFYNQRHLDLGGQIFAQNVVLHQAASPDTVGLKDFVQGYQTNIDDWPDGKVTLHVAIAEGDYVATAYTWEATFSKPIQGGNGELKPTGKNVLLNITSLVRIKGGKIAEEWKMTDAWNFFQQMGAIPAQGDLPVVKPWSVQLGTSTLSSKDSKALVAADFKAFPKSISVGVLAANYTLHTPLSLGPQPQPDFGGAALWTKQYLDQFPDFMLTGPGGKGDYVMAAEGDLVMVLYSAVAHFTKDMTGIKANGAALNVPGLSLVRIKDGQMAESWINIDTATLMMQMTAPPA